MIYIDSTGADALIDLSRRCTNARVRLLVCGLTHQPRDTAQRSSWLALVSEADLYPDLATALAAVDPRDEAA